MKILEYQARTQERLAAPMPVVLGVVSWLLSLSILLLAWSGKYLAFGPARRIYGPLTILLLGLFLVGGLSSVQYLSRNRSAALIGFGMIAGAFVCCLIGISLLH